MGSFGKLLTMAGAAGILVAPFLPWIDGSYVDGPTLYNNAQFHSSYGDVGLILTVGSVLALVALLRAVGALNVVVARVFGIIGAVIIFVEAAALYSSLKDGYAVSGSHGLHAGFYVLIAAAAAVLIDVLM